MNTIKDLKINCSSIYPLMGNSTTNAEPTKKEIAELFNYLGREQEELSERQRFLAREIMTKAIDYEPNRLSETVKTELVKIYSFEMFGKQSVSKGNDNPLALDKGKFAESESISLLSKIDGVEYEKNTELFENKYFKGVPDIIVRKNGKVVKIIEIKTAYDMPSFIKSFYSNEPPTNIWQTMGYMDILSCKDAEIVHCLVDMPKSMIDQEILKLQEKLFISNTEPLLIKESEDRLVNNMTFSDIPMELRFFRRKVVFNKLSMKDAKSRVKKARVWLKDLHEKFTKSLDLQEIDKIG
jgi:hypothetical protein